MSLHACSGIYCAREPMSGDKCMKLGFDYLPITGDHTTDTRISYMAAGKGAMRSSKADMNVYFHLTSSPSC